MAAALAVRWQASLKAPHKVIITPIAPQHAVTFPIAKRQFLAAVTRRKSGSLDKSRNPLVSQVRADRTFMQAVFRSNRNSANRKWQQVVMAATRPEMRIQACTKVKLSLLSAAQDFAAHSN